MSKSDEADVRVSACRVILGVLSGQSLNALLPKYQSSLSIPDQALLQELCFGACRFFFAYEKLLAKFLHNPLGKKDDATRVLLVLGIYQLLNTRIPPHAAIHETVEAAKAVKAVHRTGLINGILRSVQRAQDEGAINSDIDECLRENHPQWMIEKLRHNWPEHWQQILTSNDQPAPMTLRVNLRRKSRSDYCELLDEAGIEHHVCMHSLTGVILKKPVPVSVLPGFMAGDVSVQDEAAQLTVPLMQLKPGQRVLDACAAPGGKTCFILESEPTLKVIALDKDMVRLERVKENLQRLSLSAELVAADASDPSRWWDNDPFDRILLDAPCSATGVIRRHPDIKLLRRETDILELAAEQLKLLTNLWPLLRPGGILLYATCSVFPQENNRIIDRFLKQAEDASVISIEAKWGISAGQGRQLFPSAGGNDGFFYACLTKTSHGIGSV